MEQGGCLGLSVRGKERGRGVKGMVASLPAATSCRQRPGKGGEASKGEGGNGEEEEGRGRAGRGGWLAARVVAEAAGGDEGR